MLFQLQHRFDHLVGVVFRVDDLEVQILADALHGVRISHIHEDTEAALDSLPSSLPKAVKPCSQTNRLSNKLYSNFRYIADLIINRGGVRF